MAGRFRRHQNTSLYGMSDCAFLAYAGRDALAVLLAACFMRPDKAVSGQLASLSGQAASLSTKRQKRKRTSTDPPHTQLLAAFDWEDTSANPVYVTTRLGDLWCATIDFRILKGQGREGLWKFNKCTKIETEDAKMKVAVDLVAEVALRRLDGEPDESPGASYLSGEYDDEFGNYLSEDEQLAVDQQCNATQR